LPLPLDRRMHGQQPQPLRQRLRGQVRHESDPDAGCDDLEMHGEVGRLGGLVVIAGVVLIGQDDRRRFRATPTPARQFH
jgi:hypothetical protein